MVRSYFRVVLECEMHTLTHCSHPCWSKDGDLEENVLFFRLGCTVSRRTGNRFRGYSNSVALLHYSFAGQITPSPSTRVPVGYNLTIECDSGTGSLTPSLRIDSNPTSNNPRVELVSSSSGVRVFRFISVARNDSGLVFSCTNVQGQFTLEVLCKCSMIIVKIVDLYYDRYARDTFKY